MEITKFRVRNYRSIIDSGDCYLSPNITVLAGQNEAGKTSILQALEDFSQFKDIREESIPIDRDADPVISVTFKLNAEDLNDILPDSITGILKENGREVTVSKTGTTQYEIKNVDTTFPEFSAAKEELLPEAKEFIDQAVNRINSNNTFGTYNDNKQNPVDQRLSSLQRYLKNSLEERANDPNRDHFDSESKEFVKETLDDIEAFQDSLSPLLDVKQTLASEIARKMPEFVLFSTYQDQIPNQVPLDDLDSNEFIQDLSVVSDLNPQKIRRAAPVEQRRHKQDVNLRLNEDYEQFWSQDAANLSIDWNSEDLFFWIEEDGQPYPPSLRSAGRIWHLSFYVKLTARSTGDTPPVILVDDPGLHLHAKAQKDILNKLEDIASRSRVIYSTHSPYLIDTKKLNRVWLVNKSESNGTKIEKLHAGADKDTLRPVLTAIGADTTLGLHLDKDNQIVVEGISDYHYLHSFREIIDWDGDIDIIPGTGGSTPVYIGSILFGWGIDPIFCLDPDDPNRNARKLEEELGIEEEKIIYVYDGDGAIEDLFTKEDFKKYVLEETDIEYSGSNSDYLQAEDKDKVVLAKTFYEDVYANGDEIGLSEKTIEAISSLFDKIETAL